MKKCMIFFFNLVIFSSLLGCASPAPISSVSRQLVHRIQISCEGCEVPLSLECTQPENIRTILLTLRLLGPDFPARTDVDAIQGKTVTLSLDCADGSRQHYRIRNNQYLQYNHGPWRQINAQNANGLYQLLLLLADAPAPERHRRLADFPLKTSLQGASGNRWRDRKNFTEKRNFFSKRT